MAELIDSHVSLKQCKQAVEALHGYAIKKEKERAENELLPGKEEHIWLQVTVKRMQPEQRLKPIRMSVRRFLWMLRELISLAQSPEAHPC